MSTLPIKLAKQIAGKCCYSGCHDPAIDGSDFCGPHDAHERGRDAGKKRRRRKRLAEGGVCYLGCGRKVQRRRKRGGGFRLVPCADCRRKERKRKKTARRPVPDSAAAVPGGGSDPAWRVDPGTNWLRFRGKGRRGRLTREEQIDEIKRSVRFAVEELQKLDRALDQLKRPEVMELPTLQRDAAWREAGMFAGSAERHCEDCREALG